MTEDFIHSQMQECNKISTYADRIGNKQVTAISNRYKDIINKISTRAALFNSVNESIELENKSLQTAITDFRTDFLIGKDKHKSRVWLSKAMDLIIVHGFVYDGWRFSRGLDKVKKEYIYDYEADEE